MDKGPNQGVPTFLHKKCTLEFEHEQDRGLMWLSTELDVWLLYLRNNAPFDQDATVARARMLNQF